MRKVKYAAWMMCVLWCSIVRAQNLPADCQEPQCFRECSLASDQSSLESLLTMKAKERYMVVYPAHVSGREVLVSSADTTSLDQVIDRQRLGATEGRVEVTPESIEGFCITFYPDR